MDAVWSTFLFYMKKKKDADQTAPADMLFVSRDSNLKAITTKKGWPVQNNFG